MHWLPCMRDGLLRISRAPKYSSINPARSRIRVVMDELNDVYVPVRAGDYTPAECTGRNLHDQRKGILRVQLLPGFLPVQGLFQGARFRSSSEMRYV